MLYSFLSEILPLSLHFILCSCLAQELILATAETKILQRLSRFYFFSVFLSSLTQLSVIFLCSSLSKFKIFSFYSFSLLDFITIQKLHRCPHDNNNNNTNILKRKLFQKICIPTIPSYLMRFFFSF